MDDISFLFVNHACVFKSRHTTGRRVFHAWTAGFNGDSVVSEKCDDCGPTKGFYDKKDDWSKASGVYFTISACKNDSSTCNRGSGLCRLTARGGESAAEE